MAGLEGGYVAEQLAFRSGAAVHKAELLQLADEKYPVKAEKLDDILVAANGGRRVARIALLTPRQVMPVSPWHTARPWSDGRTWWMPRISIIS